jgi:hypothetical protein
MDFRQPVRHLITDASEWPHEVHDIINILRQPLVISPAAWCSAQGGSVDGTAEIPSKRQDDSSFTSSRSVNEVFGIVSSTVAALRELSSLGCGSSTVPVWSLLIKALARVCSSDCSVL